MKQHEFANHKDREACHFARVLVSREGEVTLLGPVDIGAADEFMVRSVLCGLEGLPCRLRYSLAC